MYLRYSLSITYSDLAYLVNPSAGLFMVSLFALETIVLQTKLQSPFFSPEKVNFSKSLLFFRVFALFYLLLTFLYSAKHSPYLFFAPGDWKGSVISSIILIALADALLSYTYNENSFKGKKMALEKQ